jgi:uncharacterized tellurite resistance protein B-like protein
MIANLLKRLAGDSAEAMPADEARAAIAALLVIAANADHNYTNDERVQIERVLGARYGLDAAAAKRLREEGEAAEAAAMDLYRFTSLIKRAIAHEERISVIEALWGVVLADGVRDAHEDALMRRVTDLLGLDPRESIEARKRVGG